MRPLAGRLWAWLRALWEPERCPRCGELVHRQGRGAPVHIDELDEQACEAEQACSKVERCAPVVLLCLVACAWIAGVTTAASALLACGGDAADHCELDGAAALVDAGELPVVDVDAGELVDAGPDAACDPWTDENCQRPRCDPWEDPCCPCDPDEPSSPCHPSNQADAGPPPCCICDPEDPSSPCHPSNRIDAGPIQVDAGPCG